MAAESKQRIIKLKSSDGEVFDVELDVVKAASQTVKTMVDDLNIGEDDTDEEIPLANVSAAILRKVIEWARHHKDDNIASADEDDSRERRTDDIPQWDQEFLKVDQGTLFELIQAANYLDIKGLLDVTCKTVANMIKGKSPEEIRKTFNITNDFTPEEEAVIREENKWAEEQ